MEILKTDTFTSNRMRLVKTANTDIEKSVRKVLHKLGFRFRLNNRKLPGKPDVVLRRYETVVFVNGCFWHGHNKCAKGQLRPKKNAMYWKRKIEKNQERDSRVNAQLEADGWKVLTIWECEIKNEIFLAEKVRKFVKIRNGSTYV